MTWNRKINPIPAMTPKQIAAFWDKVDVQPGLCWTWTAGVTKTGRYGRFKIGEKVYQAHRVAYALLMEDNPELELDHVCRNRLCVNPDHLEHVTYWVNWSRGFSTGKINSLKTHCVHGHELSGPNLRIKTIRGRPARLCLTCYRIQSAKDAAIRAVRRQSRNVSDQIERARANERVAA